MPAKKNSSSGADAAGSKVEEAKTMEDFIKLYPKLDEVIAAGVSQNSLLRALQARQETIRESQMDPAKKLLDQAKLQQFFMVDLGMSDKDEQRLFFIDLETGVVKRSQVMQGARKGVDNAVSNEPGSLLSSSGRFVTLPARDIHSSAGGTELSVGIRGLDASNSRMEERGIFLKGQANFVASMRTKGNLETPMAFATENIYPNAGSDAGGVFGFVYHPSDESADKWNWLRKYQQ